MSAWEFTAKVEGGGTAVFVVDAKDAAWVGLYSWWCNRYGYIYRQTSRRDENGRRRSVNVYLHREVVGLERGDALEADHLNFDRQDCRRANLEIVTSRRNKRRQRQHGARIEAAIVYRRG